MLRSVQTSRRNKKRSGSDDDGGTSQKSLPPQDSISDPLRSGSTDPMRNTEIKDQLLDEVQQRRRWRRKKRKEEEEEELGGTREEAEEILEELRAGADISDADLDVEALKKDDLEVDEVVDLADIDELGDLMNELAALDALESESPIVAALIEDELNDAQDGQLNGFPNVFVNARDMIYVEKRSQRRPFDDADTRLQVTPMSWVPNRIKTPIGRRAMDEPIVDRGLNHEIKQDSTTRDEDNDIGVRTRRRFTPGIPTADTVADGLKETHAKQDTLDLVIIIQTYHETMQSNPDLGKTFLLGAIRMMGQWVEKEEPRIDLREGSTPLEWLASTLLPSVIDDMGTLESFFDYDTDMYFYRQWLSEALRVMRIAEEKIAVQADMRRERDEDQAKTDLLDAIPEGELLEWSMDHPDDAMSLYADPDHRQKYVERLMDELFSDSSIRSFLNLADTIAEAAAVIEDDEEAPDYRLEVLQAAFLDMDTNRLYDLSLLDDMEDLSDLITQSIEVISDISPAIRSVLLSMMDLYGVSSSGLEEAAREEPDNTVRTITSGPEVRPISQALLPPQDDNAPHQGGTFPPQLDEDEDEDEDEPDGSPDDEGSPEADGQP